MVAVVCLMATGLVVVPPTDALAAGTVLFNNAFNDRTVDGVGTVTKPAPANGTNVVCLTASGNFAANPIASCSPTFDSQGSGTLRLTPAVINEVGGIFGATSFPTSNGLDVTFNSYQWGGNNADGIAFMLAAVDPANPVAPATMGSSGGSLGYSAAPGVVGLVNAYLGVGLDVFGNFSNSSYSGTGCSGNIPNFGVAAPGAVAVRGPGNVRVGYCGLTTTFDGTAASKVTLHAATRAAAIVPVEVLINPTVGPFTSASGITVASGTYKVVFTPIAQATRTLTGTLPAVSAGLYPSTSWLNASGVPKQLAFGFVGSTGSVMDNHEISDVKVLTFNPVPQLAVTTTSYSAVSPSPGAPVNYQVNARVLTGADEAAAVSVTQTIPAGAVPVGAFGTGWVCQAPIGQTFTCTTSATSFANGTALPVLNVLATVTGSSVTATLVQSSSPTSISSTDANPGASATTTAGTVPAAPTGVAISPSSGLVAGGVLTYITASTNNVSPTAVEIGTPAEQQAGTALVLLPCSSGRAVGCFNIEGNTFAIQSMPARATAAGVTVTVVLLGSAGSTTYTYLDRPAIPAAPAATAGINSATISWTAPANNGSAITGYVLTPYLSGVAQSPQSFDASTTTRTLSGLTAGGSYAFTVAATNAQGTSVASPQSNAVVPYTVPGAPAITAASAGTNAATLTWTTPANGSSPITGYVVTPYIAGTAQAPQTFTGTATTRTLTGLTAGTPYTFTVAAQNLAGTGPQSGPSPVVTPNVSPTLAFAAPPPGEVAVAYSRLLAVTNGTSPFAWSLASGTLPAGLALNPSTGLLSGTPTAAGSFPAVIQVTDASGQTATEAVTLVISAAPTLAFAPAAGEVSVAYSQQPVLTGGAGPYSWSVTAGSLPAGLTLNASTGLISGSPTVAGSYSFSVAVTDGFGQVATKTAGIVIVALPTLTFAAPPAGQVGLSYSASLSVSGGSLPLTWSISAGSLPSGLALNASTGAVTGTPTAVGSSAFTVSVVDANAKTASRSVGLVVGAGPLVIVKSADASSAAAGSVVNYTIVVSNTSSTSFSGVALTDPLGAVLDDASYNANATATNGTASFASATLSWTGTVAANTSVTITYSVTVKNPDVGNKVLADTVVSSTLGANCAAGSGDARCTSTVTVPGLTIVKSSDVTTTTPGGVVHFSIVVTNTGQTAYLGATLTDALGDVLDDASYNSDATATSGSISYTSPLLTWSGNLAVGATTTITYSVTVANPDSGNRTLAATVVSPAAGSPCPGGNPAAQCSATVTVLVPALSITNTANVATATPGDTVSYTVSLANTGQTGYAATSVTIALTGALDDATYGNDATASAGSVAFAPGLGALVWTGTLAVGALVTIHASVTVASVDVGDKVLVTAATSAAAGSTCPSGGSSPACATSVPVLIPQLTIAKSADVTTTTPGSTVHYTVTATDTGQTPYTGAAFADSLAGILDDATYSGDAVVSAGAVSRVGSTLNWTGNLAIGATVTLTYSAVVKSPDTGNLTLTGAVTSATPGSTCPAGGTAPACSNTVTVLIPGLSIVGSLTPASATPGSVVQYSVTVHNTGQTAYTGLAVTLDLVGAVDDANYNYDAVVSTGGLQTNPDGTVDWVFDLAPGASATGAVSFTVNAPDTGDRNIVVTAVADAAGSPCPAGAPGPTCNASIAVLLPGLAISKTANTSTATPGSVVGYTISVVNNGQTAYSAAALDDDLSSVLTDATYAGDATATSGSLTYVTHVLHWSGPLAIGQSATITYSVTVLNPDPGDKVMVNTVVSSTAGNNCAAVSTDPACTASVTILVPGLTIVSTAGSATTTPGATVSYSVSVTNSGATAFPVAALTEPFADLLDDASYNGDATATTGSVAVTGPGLTWTGALAVGATSTITYSLTVHQADGGNNLITGSITSGTAGSNCPVSGSDPRCSSTVAVARLVIVQSYPQQTTTPGSLLHLTATFTNTGQVPYTGISISSPSADTVDDAIPSGDQVASSGRLTLSSSAITWSGSIAVGAVVTVTGTLTVQNPDLGNKAITGTLVSAAPGNNCPSGGSDSRCTALTTVLVPGLTITKTANTTAVAPGGSVGYTITVHDSGQTDYPSASISDPLAAVLNDAAYNLDAAANIGVVSYSGSTLSWSGALLVGQTATITFSVTLSGVGSDDKSLQNVVSSTTVGSNCAPASTNDACRSVVVELTPALTIVKTADRRNATLGSMVTYTVVVTDTGQTQYPAAAFTDPLSGVLDDAGYNHDAVAGSGTVGYDSGTGVLSWSGLLTPGQSSTITYSVTIRNPDTAGDFTLLNTVTSPSLGSNCAAGAGDSRCTATVSVTNAVSLTFTKTANVASTVAGAVVSYTVTVTNSSSTSVTAANFTDSLSGVLDDATYDNNTVASGGSAALTGSALVWGGDVGALSSVSVTYSVTVRAPPGGDQILTGAVSSTSLAGSDNCLAASTDPRCTSTVPVAALLLEQHYSESSTTPGALVHLSATFTNTGQFPYVGISVSSPIAGAVDDAIPSGDETATSGTLSLNSTGVLWTGSIPVGGVITVSGTLLVRSPDPGDRLLVGTIVSAAPGNNCPSGGTDPHCTASVPVLVPGLTVSTSANTTFVIPGGTATYTITVHNTGQTAYAGATVTDSLAGVLDDATYNANPVVSSGSVTFTSPLLVWTGDLAPGASATISYSVTADSPDVGDKTMINPVSSTAVGSTCPPASGNPLCQSTVAVLTPALTVTSAADHATAVPGATVTYTITVANTGQVPFGSANVSIPLGGVLDDATYGGGARAGSGTVSIAGSTLSWAGALGTGGSPVAITYSVVVDDPVGGDFRLAQTVVSSTPGANCPSGGADPRCSTLVPIAGLRILDTSATGVTQPASVVRDTLTITNLGQVPYVATAVDASFVGSLDDAAYNGDASASSGSLALNPATGQVLWTGDVPVGATVVITGSFTVNNPDTGDLVMTTSASTAAVASNCPAASSDPACMSSVTVLIPGLTITTTADTTTALPGQTVGYTVNITDSGPTAYAAAQVGDSLVGVLNDATYSGDALASSGRLSLVGPNLTWTGDLNPSDVVTIRFTVVVNDPDLGGRLIVNSVSSDELGSSCPSGGGAASCTSFVTVLIPVVSIAVAADATTTTPGSSVGYTVTITNTGDVAFVGATVTTAIAGVIDDASYGDDATETAGAVTLTDSSHLTWTGDVPLDGTVLITYSVTVADPDLGNRVLATAVSSAAAGSTCGSAPQCSSTVSVVIPGLAVSITADTSTATPGDSVGYTITLTDTGETEYSNIGLSTSLADVLDDAGLDGQPSSSAGVATYAAPTLSWAGTLEPGDTATITYSVTVLLPDPGNKTLLNKLVASSPGSTCTAGSDSPACTSTVSVRIPALAVSTSASAPTTTPGSVVTYTVLAVNAGQTDYASATVAISLSGMFPDSAYDLDAAVTGGGSLAYAAPNLTWVGALPVGASVTITYSVTVHDPDIGDKFMTSAVTSTTPGSTCPTDGTGTTCSTVVRVLVPALVITKTASASAVAAGSSVQYTVTVTNTGQTGYEPATVTDSLAGVLDDASYSGDATADVGNLTYSDRVLVWSGALPVGTTATISYTVTTLFPATGDRSLANTALSAAPGSNCVTGSDPRCRSTVAVLVPALVVTKTADTAGVVAGGTVHYTLTATNAGQADYPAVTLTDALTGVLDDGEYHGDATATRGLVSYSAGTLSWAGALAVDESVTVNYSIAVDPVDAGDGELSNRVISTAVGSTCTAGSTDPACVTLTAVAARSITLSGLTSSVTLSGLPGSTVSAEDAVTMTVTTNSPGGYQVSIQAASGALSGTDGNPETIPIGRLGVRESGSTAFTPLSTTPFLLHDQHTASTPNGDAVGSDFQVRIPFVAGDLYSATLDYIASTQ
ncbi:putative Ig domain-containing protein [Jatrophihabitans sp.]|uniref:DUF7927 domain-containing protein n=1 Tax=Jatrophihabitans sp. TaxID=1932789 RepID=UPI0030C7211A|nr:hypothetical protein [Jatrophihabitans sp.]